VQSDPEGSLWRDPPHYWEQIVWPAYVNAHRQVFCAGDVEHGAALDGIRLLEGLTMTAMVDDCLRLLVEQVMT
jgi:nicotinamide/nicotinate riboside kinase